MTDAVNAALITKVGRESRQRAVFIPNATIRNRAFAAVTPSPPTFSVATSSALPAGSIFRPPQELRTSNVRTYQAAGVDTSPTSDQSESVALSYGYNGDTTMTLAAPKPGAQLLRKEFDIQMNGTPGSTTDFEFLMSGNGSLTRVWVDEQPTTAYPADQMAAASDGNTRWIRVLLPTGGYHRVLIEAENSFTHFRGMVHRVGDDVFWPQLRSRGRLMLVGDSIGEGNHADLGNLTANFYRAGGWMINAGQLLGLHDVNTGYSQGGTGLVHTSGTGSVPFGQRIPQDVVPVAPDALGVVCSTNDATTLGEAQQVTAALVAYVAAVKAALPDCLVFGIGPVGVPWIFGGTNMQTVYAQFQAGCTAANIPFLDTRGVFTGKTYPGGSDVNSVAGYGNSDLYASTDSSQLTTPHPNQKGHDHIARFVAPKIAKLLGIDMSTLPNAATVTTPTGYWGAL